MEILRNRETTSSIGNVFISPDICAAEEALIPPNNELDIPILVTDDLKRHDELVDSQVHRPSVLAFDNTRSHVMQNAVLVRRVGRISESGSVLRVSNLSPNSIKLLEGTRLCYTVDFKNQPLTGKDLTGRLYNDIYPDDNSWKFIETKVSNGPIGIDFWIQPSVQYKLREQSGPVVFNGISTTRHNREFVDKNLEYMEKTETPQFWVGNFVSKLYLSPNIHGVIVGLHSHGDFFKSDVGTPGTRHFPSTLLRGGSTGISPSNGNEIRTEIFGPTLGASRAVTAQVLFFESS